eukprot:scaffold945_cov170-Amphora_coffeaeformis.AAC.2
MKSDDPTYVARARFPNIHKAGQSPPTPGSPELLLVFVKGLVGIDSVFCRNVEYTIGGIDIVMATEERERGVSTA